MRYLKLDNGSSPTRQGGIWENPMTAYPMSCFRRCWMTGYHQISELCSGLYSGQCDWRPNTNELPILSGKLSACLRVTPSPILFTVFMDGYIRIRRGLVAFFVDDMLMMASSVTGMQNMLQESVGWVHGSGWFGQSWNCVCSNYPNA